MDGQIAVRVGELHYSVGAGHGPGQVRVAQIQYRNPILIVGSDIKPRVPDVDSAGRRAFRYQVSAVNCAVLGVELTRRHAYRTVAGYLQVIGQVPRAARAVKPQAGQYLTGRGNGVRPPGSGKYDAFSGIDQPHRHAGVQGHGAVDGQGAAVSEIQCRAVASLVEPSDVAAHGRTARHRHRMAGSGKRLPVEYHVGGGRGRPRPACSA